jgi:hypothetical protein
MDEDLLKKALDNDKNETILNLDSRKVLKSKNDLLEQLHLPKGELKTMQKKLKEYRLIDELKEMHFGSYIRWISVKNPDPKNIRLTNGGIVCDIKELNDDIYITCKNNMNRFFQLKMSECIIFQRISNQEKVLLHVMDYLNK